MSQGLTWIAARRMPLVALVALFALAVGMFAASQTTAAAKHLKVYDINSGSGVCLQVAGTSGAEVEYGLYFGTDQEDTATADDKRVGVYTADTEFDNPDTADVEENKGDQSDFVPIETALCEAAADSTPTDNPSTSDAGGDADEVPDPAVNLNRNFKITPNGTPSPIIELLSPSLSIAFPADTDSIVGDDSELSVSVSARNFDGFGSLDGVDTRQNQDADPTLLWVRVSGVLDNPTETATLTEDGKWSGQVEIPAGTTEGEYTVSARVRYDFKGTVPANGATDEETATALGDDKYITVTKTFTVGDAGTNAAAASLSLGNSGNDDPLRDGDQARAEDDNAPAGSTIWLKLVVTNSLGNPANAAGLTGVTVIGAGAQLAIHDGVFNPATGVHEPGGVNADTDSSGPNSAATTEGVGNVTFIKVGKAGSPPKPGTVDIYALVIARDGAPRTETITLAFTGAGTVLELGEAKNVSPENETEFSIAAQDSGGNKANLGQITIRVYDADGKAASNIRATKSTQGASTETDRDDDGNVPAILVEAMQKAEPGVYTVTVSIVGVDDSDASTTVTIVGRADDVAVEASATSSDTIGDVITVTATVTDADGNSVADDTPVVFDVSASTGLAAIGTGHGDDGVKSKSGVASAKYAVVGAGTSVISASAGGATGVVVVISTAGAGPAPSTEPADGLSQTELNNFASWSGEGSVSASELLAGIADASGVLFYDGDSWQRYGVVDGQVIPGSRDFTIRSGQTIWISG